MHLLVEHASARSDSSGIARTQPEAAENGLAASSVSSWWNTCTSAIPRDWQRLISDLHVMQEPRQLLVPKVGPPAEGFLHVDKDQSLLHGLRASW